MKKVYLIAFVLLLGAILPAAIQAQSSAPLVGGELSLGPRFGGSSGISLKKHGKSGTSATEFIGAWDFDKRVEGFTLSALFEKLAPLNQSKKFCAILGFGANFNFKDDFKLGASAMVGFDIRMKKLPITLQLDWMPTWFFVNENYFSGINIAFTARWVLNARKYRTAKPDAKK